MKKTMMILMIAIAATSVVFGQTKMSDAEKTKAQQFRTRILGVVLESV